MIRLKLCVLGRKITEITCHCYHIIDIPHFIMFYFIALHRCCLYFILFYFIFLHKLKARPFTNKKIMTYLTEILALLQCSGTKPWYTYMGYTINMTFHCWCWPWSPGWGSDCQVSLLRSYSLSPNALSGRKSLCTVHTEGMGSPAPPLWGLTIFSVQF